MHQNIPHIGFDVDAGSSDERLAQAAEILASGSGVVIFNQTVVLRPTRSQIRCEVIDRTPASRRCEHEFGVLVENAQRMLEASRLGTVLPNLPLRWSVVDDHGTGTTELWRAP